ncbi:hypothetical protein KIPB_004191, partial [Kipferlia bialata]|eukprot:g4191.t1
MAFCQRHSRTRLDKATGKVVKEKVCCALCTGDFFGVSLDTLMSIVDLHPLACPVYFITPQGSDNTVKVPKTIVQVDEKGEPLTHVVDGETVPLTKVVEGEFVTKVIAGGTEILHNLVYLGKYGTMDVPVNGEVWRKTKSADKEKEREREREKEGKKKKEAEPEDTRNLKIAFVSGDVDAHVGLGSVMVEGDRRPDVLLTTQWPRGALSSLPSLQYFPKAVLQAAKDNALVSTSDVRVMVAEMGDIGSDTVASLVRRMRPRVTVCSSTPLPQMKDGLTYVRPPWSYSLAHTAAGDTSFASGPKAPPRAPKRDGSVETDDTGVFVSIRPYKAPDTSVNADNTASAFSSSMVTSGFGAAASGFGSSGTTASRRESRRERMKKASTGVDAHYYALALPIQIQQGERDGHVVPVPQPKAGMVDIVVKPKGVPTCLPAAMDPVAYKTLGTREQPKEEAPEGEGEKDGGVAQPQRKRKMNEDKSCWFCMASPDFKAHLLVDMPTPGKAKPTDADRDPTVYISLPRGGITPAHTIVAPIEHQETINGCPKYLQKEMRSVSERIGKVVLGETNGEGSVVVVERHMAAANPNEGRDMGKQYGNRGRYTRDSRGGGGGGRGGGRFSMGQNRGGQGGRGARPEKKQHCFMEVMPATGNFYDAMLDYCRSSKLLIRTITPGVKFEWPRGDFIYCKCIKQIPNQDDGISELIGGETGTKKLNITVPLYSSTEYVISGTFLKKNHLQCVRTAIAESFHQPEKANWRTCLLPEES